MPKRHWLVKQEPEDYSWSDFETEGRTAWTGVRNFQARKNLREMSVGDQVLFYHSGKERAVVGEAEIVRAAYPDPTAADDDWSCVDLAPRRSFAKPVPLATIKADPALSSIALVRQSRLSVMPLAPAEFRKICSLGSK